MLEIKNDYDWVSKWRKKVIEPELPPFNCVSGPNINFNAISIGPKNALLHFFSKDLLDNFAYETNLYATRKLTIQNS